MQNLLNYFSGIVKLRLTGPFPEKFINLCIAQDIFLWGINKKNNEFYVYMRLGDVFRIRKIARQSKIKVNIVSHYGLPFMKKKIYKFKMMVIGAFLSMILLNVITSYIWFIDITGMRNVNVDRIKTVITDNGLKPGIKKSAIETKSIEKVILNNIPEIAWVSINFTGTRALIEVVEKTLPPPDEKSPAQIVAAKDGIITEIIALSGQPVVKVGDVIKKGDVLIAGISNTNSPIRAKGIVKARVWYEAYGEAPLTEAVYKRTGQQKTAANITVGGYVIPIKYTNKNIFDIYETEETHKKLFEWRKDSITVEFNKIVYYELQCMYIENSREQAIDKAKAQALFLVQNKLPPSNVILFRNITVLPLEAEVARVKATVESIEDIGQVVNIQ